MKISDASKPPRNTSVGDNKSATPASKAGAGAPVDKLVLAGIPEAELTPRVRKALMSLMGEVQQLREELQTARKRLGDLEQLADRDPLLDIFNRRAFVRELDRALAMIDRYDQSASLIFIDLNDLKLINDSKGHRAGDAALAHVAAIISLHIRQTDAAGRLGGDEFGVLLTQADQQQAEQKATELTGLISDTPVKWKDGDFTAHISCGVVELHKGSSADQAMEHADNAMYEAKRRK